MQQPGGIQRELAYLGISRIAYSNEGHLPHTGEVGRRCGEWAANCPLDGCQVHCRAPLQYSALRLKVDILWVVALGATVSVLALR